MNYEKELKLLCDTLKRCRIRTGVVLPYESAGKVFDSSISDIISSVSAKNQSVQSHIGIISPNTIYRYKDEFNLSYTYLAIGEPSDQRILFVGPYLSEQMTPKQLLELGERLGVAPIAQRHFEGYYKSIPIVREGSPEFALLETFCEHIWDSPSVEIYNVNAHDNITNLSVNQSVITNTFDETMFNIKAMENRYRFENELIHTVALGQIHKEKQMLDALTEDMFEKRVDDPLRNAKNYSIIMNTLLRKAAEQGGVHPIHIDKLSTEFAYKIEKMTMLSHHSPLMHEMFRAYCKLVRKHSITGYSPTVQATILLIENDLSADLTLSTLAKQQNVSPSYLSTLFKRETGKTVSSFIREKRIEYASSLLSSTHLQVQTVALHCGIMDVQYFSKLFKRQMGTTPKAYREMARMQY